MGALLYLLFVATACFFETVTTLRCLECSHVSKPIHCHTLVECPASTACGIERNTHHNGLVSYDLGCRPLSCPSPHPNNQGSSAAHDCNECCGSDLCNAAGCGFQGYPSPRGPVCYECKNTEFCEDIIGCNQDEECYVTGRYEYGDLVFTSGCKPKAVCHELKAGSNLIGRKRSHLTSRSTNHLGCETCCSGDLCNDVCQPNSGPGCGPFPSFPHGNITYTDSTNIGSYADFSCESHYALIGSRYSLCTDGHWDVGGDTPPPSCEKVCDSLPDPAHGFVRFDSSNLLNGSLAIYSCEYGYKLNGSRVRRCDGNNWNATAPTCMIGCGPYPSFPRGTIAYTNSTAVGSVATFSCPNRYTLVGRSYSRCLADSGWELDYGPSCQKTCGPLTDPVNGYVVYEGSLIINGSRARYYCNKGYMLVGSYVTSCDGDNWNVSVPSCQIVDCRGFSIPNVVTSYPDNATTYQSTALFSCNKGYVLNGTSSMKCLENGAWNGLPPDCVSVTSCYDIKQASPGSQTGVYDVMIDDYNQVPTQVYCDMDTDGGGWTVFQRRFDGSENFTRKFVEYVNGFGDVHGEYWLGLKWIKLLSDKAPQKLRVDLVAGDNQTAFATYSSFQLGPASRYTLHLGSFSGNSSTSGSDSNGMTYNNGYNFHTYDQDDSDSCGHKDASGWWFKSCTYANINGVYEVPGQRCRASRTERCMTWRSFRDTQTLRATSMKLRQI